MPKIYKKQYQVITCKSKVELMSQVTSRMELHSVELVGGVDTVSHVDELGISRVFYSQALLLDNNK